MVNMTSCFELEEDIDEEDGSKENSLGEMNKTMVALEAIPVHLNWGQIFRFPNKTCQYNIVVLQYLEIYANKVKSVDEMFETSIQCAHL